MALSPSPAQPLSANLRDRAQQLVTYLVGQRQEPGQTPDLGDVAAPQTPAVDNTRLSDELVHEVSEMGSARGVDPRSSDGVNQLLAGLMDLAPQRVDQELAKTGQKQPGAGDQGQGKKTVVEWTPQTQEGEIIGPHELIGSIKVKSEGGDQNQAQAGPQRSRGPARAGGQGAPATSGAAPAATGQGNHAPGQPNDPGKDKTELSPEAQQTVQQMQQKGMDVPALTNNGLDGAQSGAGGEKTLDVHTRCSGYSQSAWVHAPGALKPGEPGRIYDKLDNMPDDMMVSYTRRTGAELADDYEKKVQEGQAPQQALDPAQLDKLRHPVGSEK